MGKYVTYHNHDTMSILDACLKTKDLVKWAKANSMSAVGVTNHGTMSSHIDLYKECIANDIKPLLGIEFYVTENQLDENNKKIRDNYHLIAIAKNLQGWHNIIKLHNLSYNDEHYYYDPRITLNELLQYKEGLIITSACIGGVLGRPWMNGEIEKSIKTLEVLQGAFGDDFYLELQNHNSFDLQERKKQHDYNKFLIKMAKQYDIKCTIQNDSHYYLKEDWEAHQILLCKNTGSKLSNPKFKFDSHEYYLKNEVEMIETFEDYPLVFVEECINNTQEIADKVEIFDITNKKYDCPSFGEPEEVYKKLQGLTYTGLHKKFTDEFLQQNPVYKERIKEELNIIKQVGYTDYFLILDDLFNFTNSNGIYTGIGRGSCCGSLVLYCMGITEVDPIKYNLLFSRFINPSRISMADCDTDISQRDRDKVVAYIKQRYGTNHVCNIGTYGEMTAKASFKAVASILEIPFDKANKLSSFMDSNLSLEENYEQIKEFKNACQSDPLVAKAYKMALKLEGTYAQIGTHACGLVISSKPLDNVCPCMTVKDSKTKERLTSTAFEMKQIDGDLKLLKFDILGLMTLNIIQETETLIKKRTGVTLDFKHLDVTDEKTYKMLSDGYTSMVFQFESPLMQRILRQVKPKSIEDLSCVTALARPGALDSGLTEQFIRRRNGLEKVTPILEGTEELMKDSLQLPIYQENIMQISRVMAGFTGAEADTLRKCIVGDSIISLEEGFYKIEDLYNNKDKFIGSTIFSINKRYKTVKDTIVDIYDNGIQDVYELRTKMGFTIRCTATHKIKMLNEFKQLKDIKIGDSVAINKKIDCAYDNVQISLSKFRLQKFNRIFKSRLLDAIITSDLVWDKVISIKHIGQEHVYDLQTKLYHNYIANNIVVHNCIGKKDPEKLKHERSHFVQGCINNGYTDDEANKMFDIFEKFGSYGFNKCLSEDMYLKEYNCTVKDIVNKLDNNEVVKLQSYNTDTNSLFEDVCAEYHYSGKQEVYQYELSNGEIVECTPNHKFLCLDNKYYTVSKIETRGLQIKTINSDGLIIKSKKSLGIKRTYNLEMQSKYHNYIINGVISKNSHSVGYSLLSYATAYYKANYPLEFITAVLNSVADNLEKLNLYVNEASRLGIPVLPPDINESDLTFTLTPKNQIRFGLSAIKGLGKSAVTHILEARAQQRFTSTNDFIDRVKKVDKGSIQTLLRVGAFSELEKHPQRWDKMLDYLNDGKNSKIYAETLDISKAICTVVGTKQCKKSEDYQALAELKRNLGASKTDVLKKQEYNIQQEKLMDRYIEGTKKYFLQFDHYTPRERIENEQNLLGFNITTNPYKRWNDFKKFYVSQNNASMPYVDMNKLIENGDSYVGLNKFYTVAVLNNIKEIKTKKGQLMAKLDVEYFGVKTSITAFPDTYSSIKEKLQKGNMMCITGRLVEANQQYSDNKYEIKLDNIQQLNVLVNENNKCIIKVTPEEKEVTDNIVKRFASTERRQNESVERVVIYEMGGKYQILNGLCWINNPQKLLQELI